MVGENGAYSFAGQIATLQMQFHFGSRPIERVSNSPDAPSHEIITKVGGHTVQIGVAWQKTLQRGDFSGRVFFNLSFDDPSFDRAVICNAYPECENPDGSMDCNLVWKRQRVAGRSDPDDVREAA